MNARALSALALLLFSAAGPARAADDDARLKAALALREPSVHLAQQARAWRDVAALTDDPSVAGSLSELTRRLDALAAAGGDKARVDALRARAAKLREAAIARRSPLGHDFMARNAQELGEIADGAAALAGSVAQASRGPGGGARADSELRDAPAALAGASQRVGAALARAPGFEQPADAGDDRGAVRGPTEVLSKRGDDRRAKPDAELAKDQYLLKQLGYYAGPVDGRHGENTDAAVLAYKRDHNKKAPGSFDETGDITAATRATLRSTAMREKALFPEERAAFVKDAKKVGDLHYALNRALHSDLATHASFGKVAFGLATQKRLREFQTREGLRVTGEPDAATLERLAAALKDPGPVEASADQRAFTGKATIYHPGVGRSRTEGPPHDRFMAPLCTAEKFARGGCDAITVAIDQRLQVARGTPVTSPQLVAHYMETCRALGLPCDREPRFQISDTGACSAFRGPSHIDVATESSLTKGFGRALNREGITLVFPHGLPRNPKLRSKCR